MSILLKLKRASKKAGLPPGTLVHIGERKAEMVKIGLVNYNKDAFQEKEVRNIEESLDFIDASTVTWINIDGLHDTGLIEKIGSNLGIHSLVLEDVLHTTQRPKIENYEDYILIVLRMLYYASDVHEIKSEQISIILGSHYVISFQELEGDVFEPLRERIRHNKGKIRKSGADYLAYGLLDSIIDNYFVLLEKIGIQIGELEEELSTEPQKQTVEKIHSLKQEIIFLRKSVWPLREVIAECERTESDLIKEDLSFYLRDLYDHTIQVIDVVETYHDLLSGMLDLYLSRMSNKMNEVMKVLTIFASIFIPLTFIAGIYGMNFKYMPELEWKWSYPVFWVVIIVAALVMLAFFKKRKWL
ncbi:MAG: magnesium/cobalt transporter CorA [Syntrophales bacterium]|nr:magnesium/cobalt transporter CorA [Syntrophales bacterium]